MGLDQLLETLYLVSMKLLPITGVILLIYIILFFRKLLKTLDATNGAIEDLDKTLKTANRQLESLDKPLETINELSETIDHVHEAAQTAVRSTLVTIISNFSSIKEWVENKFNKQSDVQHDVVREEDDINEE